MSMIVNSVIQGLTQKMVQARLNQVDATPFYFGTHFPVKKINGFSWATIQNQIAKRNVAADIHSDNATVQRKHRPLFESVRGDIPRIAISREMDRAALKDYQTELALAGGDADATKLVQYWGEDVDFCFNGVQSELEYIAWALASNAGVLSFTTTNNSTFANEYDQDYDVDADAKVKTKSVWSDAANADIIGDFASAVKLAKDKNLNPKYAFINLNELYKIQSSEQIIRACASYIANAVNMAQTPDLNAINQMLSKQAWLNGLQLVVIDQTITREFADGSQTSGNPFADSRVILAETPVLGSTQYDILRDQSSLILRAERAHTVVKKYGEIEPQKEITIGEADAMPVFDTAYRNIYLRTDGKDW